MQDATHLRARTEPCLKSTRQSSDRNPGDQLVAEAEELLTRAVGLETQSGPPVSKSSATAERWREPRANEESEGGLADIRSKAFCHRVIRTKIGQELRAHYGLPQGLPHRMLTLLMQLDGHKPPKRQRTPPGRD
jgi:hypothetical protein